MAQRERGLAFGGTDPTNRIQANHAALEAIGAAARLGAGAFLGTGYRFAVLGSKKIGR